MRRSVCAWAVMIAVSLSACGLNQPGAHDFDELDSVRAQIAPELCGTVIYDDRSGALHGLDSADLTLLIVVTGDDAYQCLVRRVDALNLEGGAVGGWLIDTDRLSASAIVASYGAGTEWLDLSGKSHEAAIGTAYLVIQGRPKETGYLG